MVVTINGSFSNGDFTNWAVNVYEIGGENTAFSSVTNSTSNSGTCCGKIDVINGSEIWLQYVIGSGYSGDTVVSFWYKWGAAPTGSACAYAEYTETGGGGGCGYLSAATTWTKFSCTLTDLGCYLPSDGLIFGVHLYGDYENPSNTITLYIDDFSIGDDISSSLTSSYDIQLRYISSSLTSSYDVQLRYIITDNITPLNYPVEVTLMGKTAWVRIDWSDDYSETITTGF